MSLSLHHLIRTGPMLYAWNSATGSSIDVTAIDPAKKSSDQTRGRACIGVYVGVTGDLAAVVQKGQLSTNVFFKGIPVGTFLPGRFTSLLASGSVYDAGVALTAAITTTFASPPANAAAVVTAINAAIHAAVSSVPASGASAVASLDASSKYLILTPPAGDGSLKITGGTGLVQLFGANAEVAKAAVLPITGTVDLSVSGNRTALSALTLIVSAAPIIAVTSTAADLAIHWEI